jgi:hypothetical protein
MASSDGSLTQAEIYLFLDPRPVAEKNIIKMVDKSLEGVDPGEIIEGITQKIGSGRIPPEEQYRTMVSLHGGMLIAYGYQGEVLRIYLGQFV